MLVIKEFAKNGNWLERQMTKKCKTWFGTAIQFYVFHEITGFLVHIALTLIFAILTRFFPEYSDAETLMLELMLYSGIIPLLAASLTYLGYSLIYLPMRALIKWIKKW